MTKNTKTAITVGAVAIVAYVVYNRIVASGTSTVSNAYKKCKDRNNKWVEDNRIANDCKKEDTRDICFANPPEDCSQYVTDSSEMA